MTIIQQTAIVVVVSCTLAVGGYWWFHAPREAVSHATTPYTTDYTPQGEFRTLQRERR